MNSFDGSNIHPKEAKRESLDPLNISMKEQGLNELSFTTKSPNNQELVWPFPSIKTSPIIDPTEPKSCTSTRRRKRMAWSELEDRHLVDLVKMFEGFELKWPQVASQLSERFETNRTGKQCRERWLNHLRPDIKKGKWTKEEEEMIMYFYNTFGPKWSTMSKLLKNRTDNDIKNKWNSMKRAKKAATRRKIDRGKATLPGHYVNRDSTEESFATVPALIPMCGQSSDPPQITKDKPSLSANINHPSVQPLGPDTVSLITNNACEIRLEAISYEI